MRECVSAFWHRGTVVFGARGMVWKLAVDRENKEGAEEWILRSLNVLRSVQFDDGTGLGAESLILK